MNFDDHNTAGLATGSAVSLLVFFTLGDNLLSGVCGLVTYLAALFPDLDTNSIPSRVLAVFMLVVSLVFILFFDPLYPAIAGCLFMLVKCGKHRGLTHSYGLVLVALVAPVVFDCGAVFWSFAAGLLTHYACDGMSPIKKSSWF